MHVHSRIRSIEARESCAFKSPYKWFLIATNRLTDRQADRETERQKRLSKRNPWSSLRFSNLRQGPFFSRPPISNKSLNFFQMSISSYPFWYHSVSYVVCVQLIREEIELFFSLYRLYTVMYDMSSPTDLFSVWIYTSSFKLRQIWTW